MCIRLGTGPSVDITSAGITLSSGALVSITAAREGVSSQAGLAGALEESD